MNNVLIIDSDTDGYVFNFTEEIISSGALILLLVTEKTTYVFDLKRTQDFLLERGIRSLAINICISRKFLMAKISKGDY